MCRGEPCKAHSYGPSVTDTVTPQPQVGQGFQCLKLQGWVGDGSEKAVSTASTPVMQECVIHCHITMVGRRKSWVDILEFSQSPQHWDSDDVQITCIIHYFTADMQNKKRYIQHIYADCMHLLCVMQTSLKRTPFTFLCCLGERTYFIGIKWNNLFAFKAMRLLIK